jgi:hypothetical protein
MPRKIPQNTGKSSKPKKKDKYSKSFAITVTINKFWFWWVSIWLLGMGVMIIGVTCFIVLCGLKDDELIKSFGEMDSASIVWIFLVLILVPVPFIMIFLIFLVLKDIIPAYFNKNCKYFLIFSHRGIDMAGHFFSWKSIKWIGALRVSKSKVLLYWITQYSKNGILALECPRIQPIPENTFYKISVTILDRFSRQTAHLNDNQSWVIYDRASLVPRWDQKHDLFPAVSRKDITVDELFDYSACSQNLK